MVKGEEFEVLACITQHYFDGSGPGWRWYCLTCDTGTQVRKHGRKLHKTQGAAATGARYHENAKRIERQQGRWKAWWYHQLMAFKPQDLEQFKEHWNSYMRAYRSSWDVPDGEALAAMNQIQADPHFIKLAKQLWILDQAIYGGEG